MPSNNRRQGKSPRSTHLREAPPPPENGKTLTLPPEDTSLTCAQRVMVTLLPEEYIQLRDQAGGAPTAVLASPQRTDADAPDEQEQEPPIVYADPAGEASRERTEVDPAAVTACHENAAEQDRDADPDPHFEEFATATAAPARSSGPPGSASIDTAPVRSPRRRTTLRRPRQRHRAGRRVRRGWVFLASLVVVVVVAAILIEGTSRTPPSTPARAAVPAHHQAPLGTNHDLSAAADQETARIARNAVPRRAPHSTPRPSTLHTRNRHARRVVAAVHHAAITTVPTSQNPQAAASTGASPSSPSSTAPASTPATTTSSSTPATTNSSGSKSPPLYGEGGLLGAGHAG